MERCRISRRRIGTSRLPSDFATDTESPSVAGASSGLPPARRASSIMCSVTSATNRGRVAMPTSLDLTGRWVGCYRQFGREFPISADLSQTGELVTGLMTDGEATSEFSFADGLSHTRLPWYTVWLARLIVGARWPFRRRAGPLRLFWRLPRTAAVEGRVQGHRVTFCKSYQGDTKSGWRWGDQERISDVPDHRVMYEGSIADSGDNIEG